MKKTMILMALVIMLAMTSMVSAVAPNMTSVRISPDEAFTSDDLLGYCNASDADGDNLTYYYEWWNGTSLYESEYTENYITNDSIKTLKTYDSSVYKAGDMIQLSTGNLAMSYPKDGTSYYGGIAVCNSTGESCSSNIFYNKTLTNALSDKSTSLIESNNQIVIASGTNSNSSLTFCDLNGTNCSTKPLLDLDVNRISLIETNEGLIIAQDGGGNIVMSVCNSTGESCVHNNVTSGGGQLDLMELSNDNLAVLGSDLIICDSVGNNCSIKPVDSNEDMIELHNTSIAIVGGGGTNPATLTICDINGENCATSDYETKTRIYYQDIVQLYDGRILMTYQIQNAEGFHGYATIYDEGISTTFKFTTTATYYTKAIELSDKRVAIQFAHSSALITFLEDKLRESKEYKVSKLDSVYTSIDETWTFSCQANDGTSNSTKVNSTSVNIVYEPVDTYEIGFSNGYDTGYGEMKAFTNATNLDYTTWQNCNVSDGSPDYPSITTTFNEDDFYYTGIMGVYGSQVKVFKPDCSDEDFIFFDGTIKSDIIEVGGYLNDSGIQYYPYYGVVYDEVGDKGDYLAILEIDPLTSDLEILENIYLGEDIGTVAGFGGGCVNGSDSCTYADRMFGIISRDYNTLMVVDGSNNWSVTNNTGNFIEWNLIPTGGSGTLDYVDIDKDGTAEFVSAMISESDDGSYDDYVYEVINIAEFDFVNQNLSTDLYQRNLLKFSPNNIQFWGINSKHASICQIGLPSSEMEICIDTQYVLGGEFYKLYRVIGHDGTLKSSFSRSGTTSLYANSVVADVNDDGRNDYCRYANTNLFQCFDDSDYTNPIRNWSISSLTTDNTGTTPSAFITELDRDLSTKEMLLNNGELWILYDDNTTLNTTLWEEGKDTNGYNLISMNELNNDSSYDMVVYSDTDLSVYSMDTTPITLTDNYVVTDFESDFSGYGMQGNLGTDDEDSFLKYSTSQYTGMDYTDPSWGYCNVTSGGVPNDYITIDQKLNGYYYGGIMASYSDSIKVISGNCSVKDSLSIDGTVLSNVAEIGSLWNNSGDVYLPFYAVAYQKTSDGKDYLKIMTLDSTTSDLISLQDIYLADDIGTVSAVVGGCLNTNTDQCSYSERVVGVYSDTERSMYVASSSNGWEVINQSMSITTDNIHQGQIDYVDFDGDGDNEFAMTWIKHLSIPYYGEKYARFSVFEYNTTDDTLSFSHNITSYRFVKEYQGSGYDISDIDIPESTICQIGEKDSAMEICIDAKLRWTYSGDRVNQFLVFSNEGTILYSQRYTLSTGMPYSLTMDTNRDGRIEYCMPTYTTLECYDYSDFTTPLITYTGLDLTTEQAWFRGHRLFATELDGNTSTIDLLVSNGNVWNLYDNGASIQRTDWDGSNDNTSYLRYTVASDINDDNQFDLISADTSVFRIYSENLTGTPTAESLPVNPFCNSDVSNTPCDLISDLSYSDSNVSATFDSPMGTITNSSVILTGKGWIDVESSSTLDVPATITFKNLDHPASAYGIFKDGSYVSAESSVSNIQYNGNNLTFDVTGFSNYSAYPLCDSSLSVSPCKVVDDTTVTSASNKDVYLTGGDLWIDDSHTISNSNITIENGNIRFESYANFSNVTLNVKNNFYLVSARGNFIINNPDNYTIIGSLSRYGTGVYGYGFYNTVGNSNNHGLFKQGIYKFLLYSGTYNMDGESKTVILGDDYIWLNDSLILGYYYNNNLHNKPQLHYVKSDMGYPDSVTDFKLYRNGVELTESIDYNDISYLQVDNFYIKTEESFLIEPLVDVTGNWSIDPNYAPVMNNVRIAPTEPSIAQDLNGYCNASDQEGGNLTYYYRWYNGSTLEIEGNNTDNPEGTEVLVATLDSSNTTNLETWTFSCKANDGSVETDWVNDSVQIVASPIMDTVKLDNDIISVRTTPHGFCNATDGNNESLYYYYDWYVNDVLNYSGVSSPISGDFTIDYAESLEVGDNITFGCIANDGELNATSYVNSTTKVVVYNTVPNITSNYISPTNDTGILNATCVGYDANEDTISYDYILYRNSLEFKSGSSSADTLDVSVDDSENNYYLVTGDNWTLSCNVSDSINSTGYENSSTITISKGQVAPVASEVDMYPILLVNDTSISATGNASDRNFDNLNHTFTLYESPKEIQEIIVDNFTDGLVYSYERGETKIETGVETPLWTYSAGSSRYYPTTISESGGVLSLVARQDSNRITYRLDGPFSRMNYEIKENNVNMSFEAYIELRQVYTQGGIYVGDHKLYSFTIDRDTAEWDTGWQNYDLYFNSTSNVVELYQASSLVGSANLTDSNNNFLKFYIDEGRTYYPNVFRVRNLNATTSVASNYTSVETQVVEGAESVDATANFTYNPSPNNYYKVGMIANDGTDNSSEIFSYEFVSRENNTAPTSTATTQPETFIGVDDNIQGYCTPTDAEYDSVEFLYKWYLNGTEIRSGSVTKDTYFKYSAGETQLLDTLESNYTDIGDTVVFSCASYDALDTGAYDNISQEIWDDNNFAPDTPTISLYPTDTFIKAEYLTNVSFETEIISDDNENNDLRYEWRFVRNGIYLDVTTSSWQNASESIFASLGSSETSAQDTWYVRARAYDGNSYSSWANSDPINIANYAPVVDSVNIVGTPTENNTLIASCSANDIDAQSLSYEYEWYKDNVSASNGDTLSYANTQAGQDWILSCRAYDGIEYSSWSNSTETTITDTANPATLESVTISSTETGLSGRCLVNDEDGDSIDFGYKWYKNGVELYTDSSLDEPQGETFAVDLIGSITENDNFTFSCNASDNDGSIAYTNTSVFNIPEIVFNPVVSNKDVEYITLDWTTDADSVYVYKDDVLLTISTLTGYTYEDLTPNTEYELKVRPYKNGYFGDAVTFNETTETTDNNAPTMSEVIISPTLAYTDDALTGRCRGNDVENANIFYTYNWYVNGSVIDNGVTSLQSRDTTYTIGSITSTNYESGDVVTLGCVANDGLNSSSQLNQSVTITNSEPIVEVAIIKINSTDYVCDYTFEDEDNDNETNTTFTWYNNGNETAYTSQSVTIGSFSLNDELVCKVSTSDGFYNITKNTSKFIVGDFEEPEISNLDVPESVYTDSSYSISATCEDENNIAVGYPRVRFINPNFQEEEYQLYHEGNNIYSRYLSFNTAGTYTNFEFECKDGNSNQATLDYGSDLVSLVRETVINIGGGGGSGEPEEEPEEFRNITSFSVNPTDISVGLSPGSTNIVEFEVVNKDIIDIDFTTAILVTEDSETFDWMEFEGGLKAITFPIEQQGGLSTNNRFVRYYINVPEDTPEGEYLGQIEVNGLEQTITHNVIIDVREGTFNNLFGWLDYEVLEIPFTQSLTGSAIADPDNIQEEEEELEGLPLKVWHILLTLIGGGISVFAYRRYLI